MYYESDQEYGASVYAFLCSLLFYFSSYYSIFLYFEIFLICCHYTPTPTKKPRDLLITLQGRLLLFASTLGLFSILCPFFIRRCGSQSFLPGPLQQSISTPFTSIIVHLKIIFFLLHVNTPWQPFFIRGEAQNVPDVSYFCKSCTQFLSCIFTVLLRICIVNCGGKGGGKGDLVCKCEIGVDKNPMQDQPSLSIAGAGLVSWLFFSNDTSSMFLRNLWRLLDW